MKNKQMKLAALTVAITAGVMAHPVTAHAEETQEPQAAQEHTAEANLNDVLQQMKQQRKDLHFDDEPSETIPPTKPGELPTQSYPASVIETSNLSAVTGIAQKATTVGTVQAPLTEIHNQQGGLPQTGLNRMGVLGLALAGFSSLATGLGLKISDRRKKHHKC